MSTEAPRAISERYDVKATVAGGQSIVYQAWDRKLERMVAIKMPDQRTLSDPKRLEKFVEEGRKLARLDDPYVLSVYHFYELGQIDQNCYLETPWMDQSLQDILEKQNLSPEAAVAILNKTLMGIRALHRAGIIHRDLKPANIYLSENAEQVKVGDLGIASDVGADQTLSAADLTPKYHAPELFSLDGEIDRRSDIYSLGMMAYEMLVGKSNFEQIFAEIYKGTDERSRSTRWLNWHQDTGRVAPPLSETAPNVPGHIADCVARMLEKDPDKRFPDIDSVLAALGSETTSSTHTPGHTPAPAVPFQVLDADQKDQEKGSGKSGLLRSKWTWIGAAVVLFWVTVFLVVFSGPSGNKDAAMQARTEMEAARQIAVDEGADKAAGKPAFEAGEQLSGQGTALEQDNYDKARDAYVNAKSQYDKAVVLTVNARVKQSRDRAIEAKKAAEDADAAKLDSFAAAQQIFDAAESLSKAEKPAESMQSYAESQQGFEAVVVEAEAIAAWMKTDAARKAALEAGVPEDNQLYMAARAVHKSGAESLKQEQYQSASEYFEKAAAAYAEAEAAFRDNLSRLNNQPVRFTAGSTPAQLAAAMALCKAHQDQCDPGWYDSEQPRDVTLTPVLMDPLEVTNKEFARFVEETGYETSAEVKGYSLAVVGSGAFQVPGLSWRTPAGVKSSYESYLDHPVVHVALADATAFCQWAGKRLPTEDEWEFMARGPESRVFPWGNEWNPGNLVWKTAGITGMQRVGSLSSGATPAAIHDLAGNVWEWTTSTEGKLAILKGGSWTDANPANFRAAARRTEQPRSSTADDGFRCIKDVAEWQAVRY